MTADPSDGPRPRGDATPEPEVHPARTDAPRAFEEAWLDLARRATTSELRSVVRWFKRSVARGLIPVGLSLADVLELELRRLRRGRCPFPWCGTRSWAPRPHRSRADRARCLDGGNVRRLCREHHDMVDAGFILVTGPLDDPSFWLQNGRRVESRRG